MKLVKKVLTKLIEANDLKKHFVPTESGELNVTLIHNDTIIMFLNMDQRLLLSIPIIKLSKMNEEQLALLVSHELAHFLLDH